MTTDGEFYEIATETHRDEVPGLRDRTAGQFLLKMAALAEFPEGTPLLVRFSASHGLEVVTPIGVYSFLLDSEGEHLTVEQVR